MKYKTNFQTLRLDDICSVIQEPDEAKEKKLCLALNRIEGRWDTDKLGDLLRDDDVLEYETGFDEAELRVYRQLEDVRDPDVDGDDDLDGLDGEDDGEYDGPDDGEPDADDEPEPDDPPAVGTTVVRVGHLHFKVEVPLYNRLVAAIRDAGIFDTQEIAQEMKRRLLRHD